MVVVSILAIRHDDSSLNPAEIHRFSVILTQKNEN